MAILVGKWADAYASLSCYVFLPNTEVLFLGIGVDVPATVRRWRAIPNLLH